MNYYARKRRELGLTQEQLSELLGIRPKTLNKIEHNETTFTPQQAYDFDLLLQGKHRIPVAFCIEELEECRLSRGLTMLGLERLSGIKADHISRIEQHEVHPTKPTIDKFRKAITHWDEVNGYAQECDQFR